MRTYKTDHGNATATYDGLHWRVAARASASGETALVYAIRNEDGFRGRQWESSLPGAGVIGDGQHATLREIAEEAIALAFRRGVAAAARETT